MGSVCPAAGLEWTPIWVDQEQEDGKRQVKEVVRRKIREKRGCGTFEPQAHTGHRVHRNGRVDELFCLPTHQLTDSGPLTKKKVPCYGAPGQSHTVKCPAVSVTVCASLGGERKEAIPTCTQFVAQQRACGLPEGRLDPEHAAHIYPNTAGNTPAPGQGLPVPQHPLHSPILAISASNDSSQTLISMIKLQTEGEDQKARGAINLKQISPSLNSGRKWYVSDGESPKGLQEYALLFTYGLPSPYSSKTAASQRLSEGSEVKLQEASNEGQLSCTAAYRGAARSGCLLWNMQSALILSGQRHI
ncbi:hypothetical protein ACRRTK_009405 [Alexandromys fortis]